MRELKFRAWGNHIKEYLGTNLVDVASMLGDLLKQGNWTIEQYTGLKDKSGKEIYIGDVVSEHQGDIVGEVVQKPSGEYRIAWIGIFGGESVLYDHLSLCEVIGNIHDNPELLEK